MTFYDCEVSVPVHVEHVACGVECVLDRSRVGEGSPFVVVEASDLRVWQLPGDEFDQLADGLVVLAGRDERDHVAPFPLVARVPRAGGRVQRLGLGRRADDLGDAGLARFLMGR